MIYLSNISEVIYLKQYVIKVIYTFTFCYTSSKLAISPLKADHFGCISSIHSNMPIYTRHNYETIKPLVALAVVMLNELR